MQEKKQVGTVTLSVEYRLMRNEFDNGYVLMEVGNDDVLIVGDTLDKLRERLASELVDVGAPGNFKIEVKV